VSCSIVEHDAEEDQHDRQKEVAEYDSRVEFGAGHEHAEHDLPDESQHKSDDGGSEIRTTSASDHPGGNYRNDREPRDDPVAKFDSSMEPRSIQFFVDVAGWPVGTTKPGTGEAHGSTGDGDCHKPNERKAGPELDRTAEDGHRARRLRLGHRALGR